MSKISLSERTKIRKESIILISTQTRQNAKIIRPLLLECAVPVRQRESIYQSKTIFPLFPHERYCRYFFPSEIRQYSVPVPYLTLHPPFLPLSWFVFNFFYPYYFNFWFSAFFFYIFTVFLFSLFHVLFPLYQQISPSL